MAAGEIGAACEPRLAGYESEVRAIRLADVALEIVCPMHLERYVDRERLLAGGEAAEPPYWMHLWPGATALARRLAGVELPARGRVLEIGCGLALPALTAARRGCSVLASDWKSDPLRFAAASARRNRLPLAVACMRWADATPAGSFALCVGADVAYDAAAEEGLVAALQRAAAPAARLLLADSVNTHRDGVVRRLSQSGWDVRVDGVFEKEEGHNVWVRIIAARRRLDT